MIAFLELIQQKRIDVEALIDKEVPLDQVTDAYEALGGKEGARPLAIVIAYPEEPASSLRRSPLLRNPSPPTGQGIIRIGLIGVGSFAKSTHIPNIGKLKQQLQITGVCTGTGATAVTMGRQLNAPLVTNDYRELIGGREIDAVLVSTRHNNHAVIAEAALKAGKHVYLEKPLALTLTELDALDRTVRDLKACPVLMVGFNRRFSPFAQKLARLFSKRTTPLIINYRVNAGMLPEKHWTLSDEGGGRLRGEACHMVDFFRFLVNQPLHHYDVDALPARSTVRPDENFVARFCYADGSLCTLTYESIGHKALAKEWVECHWDGQSAVLDDFKNLTLHGSPGSQQLSEQDKGHAAAMNIFVSSIAAGSVFPIPWEQLYETTRATIELDREVWGRSAV